MHFRNRTSSKERFQRGVSLMELMVGITIGLLVVVAAIAALASTQLGSSTSTDASRLQLKADSLLRNMGFHITQAGAIELVAALDTSRVVFSPAYTGYDPATTGAAAGLVYSIWGEEGGTSASDTLYVSYEDDGFVRDCLGARTANPAGGATSRVDNKFYRSGVDLMCLGASNAAAQSIADGVEDFQVQYAIQTAAGNVQYYNADQVPVGGWQSISAVSVCLQLVGDLQNAPSTGATTTGCRGQSISSDGKIRRVYNRTFAIRNALL